MSDTDSKDQAAEEAEDDEEFAIEDLETEEDVVGGTPLQACKGIRIDP